MKLIRAVTDILHDYNIRLYPVYVKSKANELADLASRGHTEQLSRMLPSWRSTVQDSPIVRRVGYAIPGPFFLYGKGYLDGTAVDDAWTSDDIPVPLP